MRSVANAHRKKVFTTDRWTAGNAGLQLERLRAAPVGQQPGVDTLKQDDLSGVGIVPQSGEYPSRLRGVFDTSLSHVAQVQVGRRLDGDVVCLFDRFLADTLQFESILQLALVAMSHDRVFADFLNCSFSLFHWSQRGHLHRFHCPAFFSLLFGHFGECLA